MVSTRLVFILFQVNFRYQHFDFIYFIYNFFLFCLFIYISVPRKVLREEYDSPSEPDEPHQTDFDPDQDDLYDDDQFYRESEIPPPAPKLQGTLNNKDSRPTDIPAIENSSIAVPPLRSRNDNGLEGFYKNFIYKKIYELFFKKNYFGYRVGITT